MRRKDRKQTQGEFEKRHGLRLIRRVSTKVRFDGIGIGQKA